MSTESKEELLAEFDAATATVKAKLAAGIQIVNHCFEATPAQRMEWLAFKMLTRPPRKRRRDCSPKLPAGYGELLAVEIAKANIKTIARTAKAYAPAGELIPELKAFTKARSRDS